MQGQDIITNSSRNAFQACQRKFYFSNELGLQPTRSVQALRMGTCVHNGLDLKASGKSETEAIEEAAKQYEMIPAGIDEFEWSIERETVIRLLWGYFRRWENDGIEYLASEAQFDLPIINPDTGAASRSFRQAGKKDKIIRFGGRRMLMEHKTTSDSLEAESDYWRLLRLDPQISMYYSACDVEGVPVDGVLYDVIRKPQIEPKQIPLLDENGFKIVLDANGQRVMTKDGKKPRESGDTALGYKLQTRRETAEEFGNRLTDDIASRPDFYYARREIARIASDIEEFRQELWTTAELIRQRRASAAKLEAKGIDPACAWPRNAHSCIGFGTCPYFNLICSVGVDPRSETPEGFARVENVHPELEK